MRTTLDLDDALMDSLLRRYPGASKTQALEQALRSFLLEDAVARLRRLAGTLDVEDASAELRVDDRRA